MSSPKEGLEAIEAAIVEVAKMAAAEKSSSSAERYGSAVRQLAEARAWLSNPNQPHGGSTSS